MRRNSWCLPLYRAAIRTRGCGCGRGSLHPSSDWFFRRGGLTGADAEQSETTANAFWCVGKPVAIAVHQGRASFRAPASKPGSEVLVIVSSLSRAERAVFESSSRPTPPTAQPCPSLAVDGPLRFRRSRAESARPRQDLNRRTGGTAEGTGVSHAGARRRRLQPEQLHRHSG